MKALALYCLLRQERAQEQLWEISINIVKDYLSPEVLDKYGHTSGPSELPQQTDGPSALPQQTDEPSALPQQTVKPSALPQQTVKPSALPQQTNGPSEPAPS